MTEAAVVTVGIEGLNGTTPRVRLRRGTLAQFAHDHAAAGLRVRGISGIQYQWCSVCGALGICKNGAKVSWVDPGADAEDMVIDVMGALR